MRVDVCAVIPARVQVSAAVAEVVPRYRLGVEVPATAIRARLDLLAEVVAAIASRPADGCRPLAGELRQLRSVLLPAVPGMSVPVPTINPALSPMARRTGVAYLHEVYLGAGQGLALDDRPRLRDEGGRVWNAVVTEVEPVWVGRKCRLSIEPVDGAGDSQAYGHPARVVLGRAIGIT